MKLLIPILFFILISCYAEPGKADLDRVRQQFLVLRFYAPLSAELKNKSDKELFELSCKMNRVRCNKVFTLLQREDVNFYTAVTGIGK
jgi:hypothetical protein